MQTPAAILIEQNKPLEFAEVSLPPLSYGQVLVDVQVSRICGSQIGEIDGVKGPDRWLPHLLGHEGFGSVLEVGPEVKTVKPGDSVVLHWRPGSGIEAQCPQYGWEGKVINAGKVTTFNRYAVISENRLTAVPKEVDPEVGALLADTLTTGFGIISNDAKLKIGESVVLWGCGGIGSGVILGARLAGAYPVIAIDLYEHKLEKAKALGATHTFLGNDPELEEKIRALVGGDGADVAIDGTGIPSVIEQAYELTHAKGRCVLFGVMPHEKKVCLHTLPLHFGKILTGSEGGSSQPDKDIPRILRMLEAGCFDPTGLVSHRIPLEETNDAIAKMRSGEVMHAMIHFKD
tara:strand:+ start:81837 stop:82874 length:1038 start_codon:yes stop_codon:yes gene_type:complete